MWDKHGRLILEPRSLTQPMSIFAGPEEEIRALRWMNNRLSDKKSSAGGKKNEDLRKEIGILHAGQAECFADRLKGQ